MENMFRALVVTALVVFLSFFSSGCAKTTVPTEAEVPVPVEPVKPKEEVKKDVYKPRKTEVEPLVSKPQVDEMATISEGRTNAPMLPIYFDFDRSNIRNDQRERIEKNADYLATNKTIKIRIEGNCDERGTNEYNMALGQRRALSAKKYLVNLGIKEHRLETITFGEERPLLYGHDELSWAQNRRDDFVITK